MKKQSGFVVFPIVVIGMLASGDAFAQAAKTFVYDCDGGLQVAAYFDRKAAYLQLDGKSLRLPQRLSGSGARYAKSGVSFWIKGNTAMLRRTRTGPTVNCVAS
jgi:putative lipoprotein